MTFDQPYCAIISLTTGRVHTTVPIQGLPIPLVRPELRWEPYTEPPNQWELSRKRGAKQISQFVVAPTEIAIFLSTLLASLHADGVSFGPAPWTIALIPLMCIIAVCIPYIGWHRNQERTVDELILTLVGGVVALVQVILLALRLDYIIFTSISYTLIGLPIYIMFGLAVIFGCWHGYEATVLHSHGDGCRVSCSNFRYLSLRSCSILLIRRLLI
jgi:hypothetical protein